MTSFGVYRPLVDMSCTPNFAGLYLKYVLYSSIVVKSGCCKYFGIRGLCKDCGSYWGINLEHLSPCASLYLILYCHLYFNAFHHLWHYHRRTHGGWGAGFYLGVSQNNRRSRDMRGSELHFCTKLFLLLLWAGGKGKWIIIFVLRVVHRVRLSSFFCGETADGPLRLLLRWRGIGLWCHRVWLMSSTLVRFWCKSWLGVRVRCIAETMAKGRARKSVHDGSWMLDPVDQGAFLNRAVPVAHL